jgi:hypothetical protein
LLDTRARMALIRRWNHSSTSTCCCTMHTQQRQCRDTHVTTGQHAAAQDPTPPHHSAQL